MFPGSILSDMASAPASRVIMQISHKARRAIWPPVCCLLGFLLLPPISVARQQPSGKSSQQEPAGATIPRGKKLVMKDGTYQIVSSYQILGDRVRYYSVERAEWEEIPTALVDWTATKKAQAEAAAQAQALVGKVKAEEIEERAMPLDVDASLEILPGVFLPPGDGVFLLDGRAIFPLHKSAAFSKLSKKRFIVRAITPIPIVPSLHTVELQGAHASFRITNPAPEFYLRTTDPGQPQIDLIRARVKGNKRQIENIETRFMQQSAKRKTVSLQEWEVAKGVYRFTLGQPLAPGEYALAEISPKQGMNLLVWDFGVDRPRRGRAKNRK